MAPRSVKSKKDDIKVVENETVKRIYKNKTTKNIESEAMELDLNEKNAVSTEKTKRNKKLIKEQEEVNGITENNAPLGKKGRKKNVENIVVKEKLVFNGEDSEESSSSVRDGNGDVEMTGNPEKMNTDNSSRGRKKQSKKEVLPIEIKSRRGKKTAKQETVENNGTIEEKPKSTSKGKGRKGQPKVEVDSQTSDMAERDEGEIKTVKSRRKAHIKIIESDTEDIEVGKHIDEKKEIKETKVLDEHKKKGRKAMKPQSKEKTEGNPENEKDELQEQPIEHIENTHIEEVKKKYSKGRKGTKAQAKEIEDEVESEQNESQKDNKDIDQDKSEESKPEESSKKKERKNQSKKAKAKNEIKENDEEPAAKKRKVTKKDDKGSAKDDKSIKDDTNEAKINKRKHNKKHIDSSEDENDKGDIIPQSNGEPTSKRRRKAVDVKVVTGEKKTVTKNKSMTNYDDIDFSNTSQTTKEKDWNFKIASWNVDGIRAWLTKGGLDYIKYEKPDILCLQETKCAQEKLPDEIKNVPGYHAYWLCSDKDGYAGVGIYTTKLAINIQYGLQNEELDSDGRIITAEYEQFYLICTYVPNAGRKLITLPKRLQWNDEFRKYVKELDKKKPVIICGDMNVAHNEIDLANPKTNRKNAGFTDEERSGMSDLLGDGFVDTYRHLYPDKTGAYTFWTYMMNSRAKNVGWRLDYFIVSERLLSSLCDNVIRNQVYGSDHCPITLFLHLSNAYKPKE